MFQAIENDACGEHFSVHNFCLFVVYWVRKKHFNLIHSKALNYLLFLQLPGRGESSSSSTHEPTFGFSKQLMGACAALGGSCKWLHSFLVLSMNTHAIYWLYFIMHNCRILSDFSLFILSMGEIFLWSFQFIGNFFLNIPKTLYVNIIYSFLKNEKYVSNQAWSKWFAISNLPSLVQVVCY
jgi:hypothetical protein